MTRYRRLRNALVRGIGTEVLIAREEDETVHVLQSPATELWRHLSDWRSREDALAAAAPTDMPYSLLTLGQALDRLVELGLVETEEA